MWEAVILSGSISFVLGIVVASLLWKREVKRGGANAGAADAGKVSVEKNESIVSESDKALFQMVVYVVGKESMVLPKVSLAAVVSTPKTAERRELHQRSLRSRVLDIVLCDHDKIAPALVIQRGDPEDEDGETFDDDEFIATALKSAHIPVLWLNRKKNYMPNDLKELMKTAINRHYTSSKATVVEVDEK